ncbi:MAG: hypothetical protein IKF52_07105 [Clostridia bacterium]|nr:hypothetical protein [Clostridia bacterium]
MIKELFRKVRSEYGFTGQDLIIAMFILVLFLGLMTGVYVNLSNTSYEIKLTADATEINTNILEYYDGIYYDEVSTFAEKKVNSSDYGLSWDDKYDVYVSVTENQEKNKKDIKVKVNFDWKDETHNIENSMTKEKEPIKPANSPVFDDISLTPIKYVYDDASSLDGHFVKTEKTDNEWYDYGNKKLAVAVSGGEFQNNNLVSYDDMFIWIPAFFLNDYDEDWILFFYYKDTDKVIKKNENGSFYLDDDTNVPKFSRGNYYRHGTFDNKNGIWVRVSYDGRWLSYLDYTEDDDFDQMYGDFIDNFDWSNTKFLTND